MCNQGEATTQIGKKKLVLFRDANHTIVPVFSNYNFFAYNQRMASDAFVSLAKTGKATKILALDEELKMLKIEPPHRLLDKHPPPCISLGSLAKWIPIGQDYDCLDVKIGEYSFRLRVSVLNGLHVFVYHTPNHEVLRSSSPFRIIRRVCKKHYPLVNIKSRGWNSILYLGHSLVWWRRQYMSNYVAGVIYTLSSKIVSVALHSELCNSASDDSSKISYGGTVWTTITFVAEVKTTEDKTAIQKVYPFLQVRATSSN